MRRGSIVFFWLAITPAAVATLAAMFARAGHPFELAVHFRPHYLALGGAAFIASVVLRTRALALGAAAVLAVNLAGVLLVPRGAPTLAEGERGDLVVVWGNIQGRPDAAWALIDLALAVDADVVMAAETEDIERAALAQMLDDYQCRSLPPAGEWGVAAFARGECSAFSAIQAPGAPGYNRYWQTRLDVTGLDTRGVHVYTPLSEVLERGRNQQIAMAAAPEMPGMAVGDFNASPWSPPILKLQRGGLRRVPCGGPYAATWPAGASLIAITIDHAFVTEGLAASCEVGPDLGSDHYPLIVRIKRLP